MNKEYIHFMTPDPSLREYIRSYTFIDIPSEKLKELEFTVFPSSNTRMVFSLGEPSFQKVDQQIQKTENYSLTGFYSRPHTFIPASTSVKQVIIQFSPWGLQPILNFPLSEITDQRADLSLIFRYELEALLSDLYHQSNWTYIKQALDTFFIHLFKKIPPADYRIKPIIQLISQTHGSLRLRDLSKETFLGERTIQRLVHNQIGIPYKFFTKLVRTEFIRRSLNTDNLSLSDLALSAGYFDQAHFNHDFLSMYGESPGDYQKRLQKLIWNKIESNKD